MNIWLDYDICRTYSQKILKWFNLFPVIGNASAILLTQRQQSCGWPGGTSQHCIFKAVLDRPEGWSPQQPQDTGLVADHLVWDHIAKIQPAHHTSHFPAPWQFGRPDLCCYDLEQSVDLRDVFGEASAGDASEEGAVILQGGKHKFEPKFELGKGCCPCFMPCQK